MRTSQHTVTRQMSSTVIPGQLPREAKLTVLEEPTDASTLLGLLAEWHGKAKRGARR
jgi:hypothetical protein